MVFPTEKDATLIEIVASSMSVENPLFFCQIWKETSPDINFKHAVDRRAKKAEGIVPARSCVALRVPVRADGHVDFLVEFKASNIKGTKLEGLGHARRFGSRMTEALSWAGVEKKTILQSDQLVTGPN